MIIWDETSFVGSPVRPPSSSPLDPVLAGWKSVSRDDLSGVEAIGPGSHVDAEDLARGLTLETLEIRLGRAIRGSFDGHRSGGPGLQRPWIDIQIVDAIRLGGGRLHHRLDGLEERLLSTARRTGAWGWIGRTELFLKNAVRSRKDTARGESDIIVHVVRATLNPNTGACACAPQR